MLVIFQLGFECYSNEEVIVEEEVVSATTEETTNLSSVDESAHPDTEFIDLMKEISIHQEEVVQSQPSAGVDVQVENWYPGTPADGEIKKIKTNAGKIYSIEDIARLKKADPALIKEPLEIGYDTTFCELEKAVILKKNVEEVFQEFIINSIKTKKEIDTEIGKAIALAIILEDYHALHKILECYLKISQKSELNLMLIQNALSEYIEYFSALFLEFKEYCITNVNKFFEDGPELNQTQEL